MQRGPPVEPANGQTFPMMTVPLEILLAMTRIQAHEDLMKVGALVEFDDTLGTAMFVSHQWVHSEHPDPEFQQFAVLQEALKNLVNGKCRASLHPGAEASFGRVRCPKSSDFASLYVWYDYFSCPQGNSKKAADLRRVAIRCIASYVTKSFFFVILCPSLQSDGRNLSRSTWEARGWCRLEQMARHLAGDDGFMIDIKTATHPTLVFAANGLCKPPCTGHFSLENDRATVGQVVAQMLHMKLHSFLKSGDIHRYRFLRNLQHHYLQGFVGLTPSKSLEPDFDTTGPREHPNSLTVASFLHDNQFKRVLERDSAGWTPLCYAVLLGKDSLVRALLRNRANPNDATSKRTKHAFLTSKIPVLSMAASYSSKEVVEVLLSARANINARCAGGATPLHWSASISDNAATVRLLLHAKANPFIRAPPGVTPFRTACCTGSIKVIQEMLTIQPPVSLRFALHSALAFDGENTISCLIDASADVNERLQIPMARTGFWAFMKTLQLTHYLSPSALTFLAYHHYGATPAVFSVLTGKFETLPILVAAGARLDIPNDRGKTAADFLQEMQVPWRRWSISLATTVSSYQDEDSDDTISIWFLCSELDKLTCIAKGNTLHMIWAGSSGLKWRSLTFISVVTCRFRFKGHGCKILPQQCT